MTLRFQAIGVFLLAVAAVLATSFLVGLLVFWDSALVRAIWRLARRRPVQDRPAEPAQARLRGAI